MHMSRDVLLDECNLLWKLASLHCCQLSIFCIRMFAYSCVLLALLPIDILWPLGGLLVS